MGRSRGAPNQGVGAKMPHGGGVRGEERETEMRREEREIETDRDSGRGGGRGGREKYQWGEEPLWPRAHPLLCSHLVPGTYFRALTCPIPTKCF